MESASCHRSADKKLKSIEAIGENRLGFVDLPRGMRYAEP